MTRFSRQSEMCPQERLAQENIAVIGTGSVGRQICLSLAAIGAKYVTMVDFDQIDESNIATQGYSYECIGMRKVDALYNEMERLNVERDAIFQPISGVWSIKLARSINPTVIFSCVDNMSTRKSIWSYFNKVQNTKLFIDGRMQGTNLRMLVAQKGDQYYTGTLFSDKEAHDGRCTQKTTYYCATTLANLMVNELARFISSGRNVKDILFNMLSYEIEVIE